MLHCYFFKSDNKQIVFLPQDHRVHQDHQDHGETKGLLVQADPVEELEVLEQEEKLGLRDHKDHQVRLAKVVHKDSEDLRVHPDHRVAQVLLAIRDHPDPQDKEVI